VLYISSFNNSMLKLLMLVQGVWQRGAWPPADQRGLLWAADGGHYGPRLLLHHAGRSNHSGQLIALTGYRKCIKFAGK
jgi:hypothetical protein